MQASSPTAAIPSPDPKTRRISPDRPQAVSRGKFFAAYKTRACARLDNACAFDAISGLREDNPGPVLFQSAYFASYTAVTLVLMTRSPTSTEVPAGEAPSRSPSAYRGA